MTSSIGLISIVGFVATFFLIIVCLAYLITKRKFKHRFAFLAISILTVIFLLVCLLLLDLPKGIPSGGYEVPGTISITGYAITNQSINLHAIYEADNQRFLLTGFDGLPNFKLAKYTYFRGEESFIVSTRYTYSADNISATIKTPALNTKVLGVSYLDRWYAISNQANAFYIAWAVMCGLAMVLSLILTKKGNKTTIEAVSTTKMTMPVAPTSISKIERICPNCGEKIGPEDNYCGNCGLKLKKSYTH